MEISYCDLKQKEVVNVADGKRLGRIIDLVISLHSCRVLGVVVPGNKKIFNTRENVFVPWKNIQKIGDDVILVCLTNSNPECGVSKNCCDHKHKNNYSSFDNVSGGYKRASNDYQNADIVFDGENIQAFSEDDE